MKKSFVLALKLLLICAIASGILAFTNANTEPIIKQRQEDENKKAYAEVFKTADNFKKLDDNSLINDNVLEVIEADKGNDKEGYVIHVKSPKGYSDGIRFMVGIDKTGKVVGFKVLEHSETSGFGAKIEEEKYTKSVVGDDFNKPIHAVGDGSKEDQVEAITGATYTTKAMEKGFNIAIDTFKKVMGK